KVTLTIRKARYPRVDEGVLPALRRRDGVAPVDVAVRPLPLQARLLRRGAAIVLCCRGIAAASSGIRRTPGPSPDVLKSAPQAAPRPQSACPPRRLACRRGSRHRSRRAETHL